MNSLGYPPQSGIQSKADRPLVSEAFESELDIRSQITGLISKLSALQKPTYLLLKENRSFGSDRSALTADCHLHAISSISPILHRIDDRLQIFFVTTTPSNTQEVQNFLYDR